MDGKSKKILNFMKKNGNELEADDIAFPLKMDEDLVRKLLGELKGEGLVDVRTDEKGRDFFTVAAEQPKADKRAKSNDDAEVPEPRQNTPRIITENQVLDMEDFSPQAAPAPVAAPPAASPPPIQTYEEHVSDFTPQSETYDTHTDTFSPPVAPIEPAASYADDDFEPKAKKKKVKEPKEPKIKVPESDDGDDFEPKERSGSSANKLLVPIAALLVIIAFVIGLSSVSGKVQKAVKEASADFVTKEAFDPAVKEKADKINSVEEQVKTLTATLEGVRKELDELKAAAARPAPAAARGGRAATPPPRRR
ncbi:MAG: hypothetical protein FWE57_04560 [Chitinispirillia bacterium]|nr:hypothetical protein [Chitinispirillia bacterium]